MESPAESIPDKSSGEATTRGEKPASQQPSGGRRYLSIDILRAVAILFMIQVHAVDHLAGNVPPAYLYNLSQLFGYMAAPLFALLSGLSYSLWLRGQTASARTADQVVKYGLRRGMFVFALGFAVNIFIWLPASTFDWDILALIGAAAIILVGVRNWPLDALATICVVILIASPPLRDVFDYASYWSDNELKNSATLGRVLAGLLLSGYFPLLPWLLFPLTGFALGRMFYSSDDKVSVPLVLALFGAALLALALLGALLQPYLPGSIANYYASGWPTGFYPATTVFILGSVGGICICLWILNHLIDLNRRVTGTGPVLMFFRRYSYFALTAYVVHLAVQLWPLWILAWWEQKRSIDYYFAKLASIPTALVSALVLVVVLYPVLVVLDHHKKYSLEHFMRWICT